MWNSIIINELNFYYKLKISSQNIIFFLTNLKHVWKSKTYTQDEFLKKAKICNKRIEFDADTVLNAIKTIPKNVETKTLSLNELSKELDIKLKYYICERPFIFEWTLILCDQNEFAKLVTIPLVLTLNSFQKENEELLKIIGKKDIEINQYKSEGCVLVRSSVATQPVNIDNLKKTTSIFNPLANEKLKSLEEICKDDVEDVRQSRCDEILSATHQSIKTIQKSPIKSKKKRLIKKREELAEKRLCGTDKITYYESPSFIEDDAESKNLNRSISLNNNLEPSSNETNSDKLKIEEIKNSLAELNRKSEMLKDLK